MTRNHIFPDGEVIRLSEAFKDRRNEMDEDFSD